MTEVFNAYGRHFRIADVLKVDLGHSGHCHAIWLQDELEQFLGA